MEPKQSEPIGRTLFLSYSIVALGLCVDQAFRWTDTLQGLINGTVYSVMFLFTWCMIFLPWCFIIRFLFRWREWTGYRSVALAPSLIVFCVILGALIFEPPTPRHRLKQLTGADLPASARDVQYYFSGGGLADYTDTYFFTCSPSGTEQLISDLRLEKSEGSHGSDYHLPAMILAEAPDFKNWGGHTLYKCGSSSDTWFYYLLTNTDRTLVYIFVGSI